MALRTPLSVTPHLYMGDSTGRPLDKGVVYFGEQDKDPEFYPINLFSDDALTKPLAQPVHTKGGYLYDKGDMVEPHAKELIYSVKVLDSYGRKVFYKGAMMRNSWNDDVIEQINTAIIGSADVARQVATNITNDAINNTAVEGGVLADTFVVVDGSLSQRTINKGLESIADLLTIKNPKDGLRVDVKSYWPDKNKGGNTFVYDASVPRNKHNGGTIIDPTKTWDGTRDKWAFVDGYLPDVGVGVWGVDDVSVITQEVKSAIALRGGNTALGSGLNPTNFRTNQINLGGFLGKSTSTGKGCWVAQTNEISFTMFGAMGDAEKDKDGTDDSYAMLAAVRALPKKRAVLNLEGLYYTHGNGDIRNIVLHFIGIDGLVVAGNNACIQSHSNNLPVTSQAIVRFDYVKDAMIIKLNADGRLDTRMVVGSDANTHNEQHNIHVGVGCKNIQFNACTSNRAMMDGFYVYGEHEGHATDSTSNIHFLDCHADECYRQGLSQITALGVRVTGGSYTNTGTCKDKITGAEKGISPMRGIDIEANESDYTHRAEYLIDGVTLTGNKNAGFSASNNSYGVIQNCVVTDNKYIGILIESNARNTKVINNNIGKNTDYDIFVEVTHPITIQGNKFRSDATYINSLDKPKSTNPDAQCIIHTNTFTSSDGVKTGGGLNIESSKTIVDLNTFTNTKPSFFGGYDKHTYTRNTFKTTDPAVTSAVRTWTSARFANISDNKTELVNGLLIDGQTQANIDYSARNYTNTDPNSGKLEVVQGKIIWSQAERVAFLDDTPTVDNLKTQLNNLIGAMISQGIMK